MWSGTAGFCAAGGRRTPGRLALQAAWRFHADVSTQLWWRRRCRQGLSAHGCSRHASAVSCCDGEVRLRHVDGETAVAARWVIVANGLGGNLLAAETPLQATSRSRLGAGTVLAERPNATQRARFTWRVARAATSASCRLEDGTLDVAAAFDPPFVPDAGGLGRAAEHILRQAGFPPIPGLSGQSWLGTPRLTRRPLALPASGAGGRRCGRRCRAVHRRGHRVGFLSCAAVADIWSEPDEVRGRAWTRWHHHAITRRQWVCRLVAAALRRPRLMATALELLAHAPWLANPVLHYVHGSTVGCSAPCAVASW